MGKNFVTFTLLVESEVFLPFNKEIELNLSRNRIREKVILNLKKFKNTKKNHRDLYNCQSFLYKTSALRKRFVLKARQFYRTSKKKLR